MKSLACVLTMAADNCEHGTQFGLFVDFVGGVPVAALGVRPCDNTTLL